MKLTGKCKEEFEEWIYGQNICVQDIDLFESKSPSMQWGVIQDYFDSVSIQIDINFGRCIINKTPYWNYYFDEAEELIEYKSRQEARTKAIDKANEIRNEQLK